MTRTTALPRHLMDFIVLYALFYAGNAVYGTFLPVYLDQAGFTQTAIGSLLALGPLIAILAQPLWGLAGDRAQSKNNVLLVLILGSALSVLLYRFSVQYAYLAAVMTVFTFFQTSIAPMSDAITLEYLDQTRIKFSTIRMAGTLGFAFMSIFAGMYAQRDISTIFILYCAISLLMLLAAWRLPKVKGHQSQGRKMSLLALLYNRPLLVLLGYATLLMTTLSFFYAFFAIYFRQMGGNSRMLGWAMFIAAICEVPFLFFAHRIIKRLGPKGTLIGAGLVMALRWLLLSFVTNPYWVLPLQALHGLSFIVISYTMVTYINDHVPLELKASGQTFFGLVGMGISRIVASLLGGALSDLLGIRQVFFYNALLLLAASMFLVLVSSPSIEKDAQIVPLKGGMEP